MIKLAAVAILSIFVAAQAPQLVSSDIRHRVVGLYFSRPMSRADYLRAKLLAMAGALMVVMGAPLLVLYVGALLAKMPVGSNTVDLLRALAGAAVLTAVLSAISVTIAAFTPRSGSSSCDSGGRPSAASIEMPLSSTDSLLMLPS